ncbi:RING finger protein 32 [Biomphalaria glabrata]|nr:RING finger protein 32 [Biomphalaria glabrata]
MMSKKVFDKNSTDSSSVTLTAVALQDHWSRTLALGLHNGRKKIGSGPAARAKQKVEIKAIVDTGLHKTKKVSKKETNEEKEYVLDEKPPPLTLAQKYGLVNAPKQLLSEQEWKTIKAKSNGRDDSNEPCVICKEDFGLQEQVLLSCTHVFHKACLQAFERFTGKKTCPMCRHEQYQTRVIHEGSRLHKHKSATKIQSLWRGYVVRSWYKKLRETVPPKDPMLRKKFYEEKLTAIVDRMINSIDVNMSEFLQEIDSSVQQSRAAFSMWDAAHVDITSEQWDVIQLKAVERDETDCPICLTELQLSVDCSDQGETTNANSDLMHNNANTTMNSSKHQPLSHNKKQQDRELLKELSKRAIPAGTDLAFLRDSGKESELKVKKSNVNVAGGERGAVNARPTRSTVLLSCSHVFHSTCLKTLEEIAMLNINTCPVCRAHYQKKILVF